MSRVGNVLARVLRAAVLVSFLVLISAVVIQVVSRVALPRSPVWTEELSRVALLYLVAIGGGLSIRTGDLVNVDLLISSLKPKPRRWLARGIALCSAIFVAALIPSAWRFVSIGGLQTSPTLGSGM
ncbi:MAG TPA: TRAP transporter small permease subunit, partial [Arenibaculum sp.]|nr:TRAP transporter small permease subunit [Arenibaculum sp.]